MATASTTPESDVAPRRIRAMLIKGMCAYCDEHRDDQMMPPHDASPRCESGKRNHCTCDVCF
jgi:hypothetical protein